MNPLTTQQPMKICYFKQQIIDPQHIAFKLLCYLHDHCCCRVYLQFIIIFQSSFTGHTSILFICFPLNLGCLQYSFCTCVLYIPQTSQSWHNLTVIFNFTFTMKRQRITTSTLGSSFETDNDGIGFSSLTRTDMSMSVEEIFISVYLFISKRFRSVDIVSLSATSILI